MKKRTNTAVWLEKYGRWQINVQKDGIRKTFSSSTPGRTGQREANRKADEWLDDNIDKASTRCDKLYNEWIDELKLTTSRSHWTQYAMYGRTRIIPEIGRIKIGNVNEQHLQNVINKGFKAGLAKKTLQNIKACMTAFIKWCRKNKATQLLVENLTIPKNAAVGERTILQPQDLSILFSSDESEDHGKAVHDTYINAYRFEVVTGLRPGELIALKKSDLKGNCISIRRSINTFHEETRGKNDNARRNVALTPIAAMILADQEKLRRSLGYSSDFIFPNEQDDFIRPQTYRVRWQRYCRHNGISRTTPYELRHTFVSMMKNLPEGTLKQLVGHSRSMDTYGVYSHEMRDENERTASMLQEVLLRYLPPEKTRI